jgi:hypothetical protein
MPVPFSDHAVFLKATTQHGRREMGVLCCGLEKNGMVGAWHGYGMANMNQISTACCTFALRRTERSGHGTGMAWQV